jgi:MFS transporter, DHA2 family, multidrug resistance protein
VPRGVGTMLAMFCVARIINRVDNRLFILVGFLLTAASLWQMTRYSLYRVCSRFRVRLHLRAAQSSRSVGPTPPHLDPGDRAPRPDAHAWRQHRHRHPRNSTYTEYPDRSFPPGRTPAPGQPTGPGPYLSAPFSLTTPSGIAALNHEVTRQAAMIGYIDDFALMLIVILASLPLLLLVRVPRRRPVTAVADD